MNGLNVRPLSLKVPTRGCIELRVYGATNESPLTRGGCSGEEGDGNVVDGCRASGVPCTGVFHPKWDERLITVVVKKHGAETTREELPKFYEGKAAKWQIPYDVVCVEAIPIGATGKTLRTKLCELLKDYRLPEDRG